MIYVSDSMGINIAGINMTCTNTRASFINPQHPQAPLPRPNYQLDLASAYHSQALPHRGLGQGLPCVSCVTRGVRMSQWPLPPVCVLEGDPYLEQQQSWARQLSFAHCLP